MNLNRNVEQYIPAGTIIGGISAEYGDDYERDFLTFHLDYSPTGYSTATIDSVTGNSVLIEIKGDLSNLIESPVIVAYVSTNWELNQCYTDIVIRTALGEVTFVWVGDASYDLEVQ